MENVCILTPITLPRSLFSRLRDPALLSKCLTNRVREKKSGNRVRPFSALIKTYVKRQRKFSMGFVWDRGEWVENRRLERVGAGWGNKVKKDRVGRNIERGHHVKQEKKTWRNKALTTDLTLQQSSFSKLFHWIQSQKILYLKRLFEPVTSCVRDQCATTVSKRQR